eukprot:1106225-Prymnesium_polylepis.1
MPRRRMAVYEDRSIGENIVVERNVQEVRAALRARPGVRILNYVLPAADWRAGLGGAAEVLECAPPRRRRWVSVRFLPGVAVLVVPFPVARTHSHIAQRTAAQPVQKLVGLLAVYSDDDIDSEVATIVQASRRHERCCGADTLPTVQAGTLLDARE